MSHSHYYQSNDSSGSHAGKAPISSAHNSFFGLAENNQTRSSGYIPSETRYNGLDNLTIIGSASKQMLLASENAAYFELFQDNMRLKAELNAKIELIAHLKEKDKIPITNHPIASSSTTNLPTLVIPNPPPPCDQDDFEDVRFWTRAEWNAFTEKQREKGITPPKLGFICQENGKVASDARLTAMGQEAQELWAELYRERQDPPSWEAKTRTAADFFSNSMRLKFDEFRYCDNDWKIEAFATIRYPDFVRYPRASGRLARRDPSLHSSLNLKRKSDADDKGSKPLPPKKRRIAVHTPTVSEFKAISNTLDKATPIDILQSLPVEILYELQLLALSPSLPMVSSYFVNVFKNTSPFFKATYILARVEASKYLNCEYVFSGKVYTRALRYPICGRIVFDIIRGLLKDHKRWPIVPIKLPGRLFLSLLPANGREWSDQDYPLPFLRDIYGAPNLQVTSLNDFQGYALTKAVRAQFTPLVKFLLDKGASPKTKKGIAVKVAIRLQDFDMFKMLVESWPDVKSPDKEIAKSMMELAISSGASDIVEFYREKGVVPNIGVLKKLVW